MITPEQALAIYHAGPDAVVKVICELSRQVDLLQKRVETLERKVAQLSKNSSNSSKPPSSDITKPKAKKHGRASTRSARNPDTPNTNAPLSQKMRSIRSIIIASMPVPSVATLM